MKDLRKNWGTSLALLVLLTLSALLMATGAGMLERLSGSVDALFAEAEPPHLLQMHKGDYDEDAVAEFAAADPRVAAWLIEDMLGYGSAALTWQRPATGQVGEFSESLIDNLFVVQNEQFDFLLDETGHAPRPAAGEVYVPVEYQQRFDLEVGDLLSIRTEREPFTLEVRGFVRDAQMASSMSSATRFVISEADFAALGHAGGASPEIIAEFRLHDPALAGEVQAAYEANEALPKNGQAVIYDLIRMLNVLSDGLAAIALMFLSMVLIAISLLSVRFAIRGTLVEQVREIGALKAIGIPARTISNRYLRKYALLTAIACLLGGVLAIPVTDWLTRDLRVHYAEAAMNPATVLVPLLALLTMFLFVLIICRSVLRGVHRAEVVTALVHGSMLNPRQTLRRAKQQARTVRRSQFASRGIPHVNRRLALVDLRAEFRQWLLVPTVFFLTAVLMMLPLNLLSTLESPGIVSHMGAAEADIRVDLQFSEAVAATRDSMLAEMAADARITDYQLLAQELYEAKGEAGWGTFRVDVGEDAGSKLEYLAGSAPAVGEIALSKLNADLYGLEVGQSIRVRTEQGERSLPVSGIYQDITSGGLTAKMPGTPSADAEGYVLAVQTAPGVPIAALAEAYGERYPEANVVPMLDYAQQTLSFLTSALRSAAVLGFVFGIGVALLITSLFLGLQLGRDRRKLGILSALGFGNREIAAQVRGKTLLLAVIGTALGVAAVAVGGDLLVGGLLQSAGLGIVSLHLIPNPLLAYVVYPLILIGAGYLAALALTARLHRADTSAWLRA